MKILFICQYYAPEPFRHPDMCRELVEMGHEVTVVTGLPNYPMGEIYEGYRHGKRRDEVLDGVKVHRCFTVGRKHGPVFRFLNYYSFALSSTAYVKKLKASFDVVFVQQLSPVMMGQAGVAYKKKHGTPLVLYCLDLWPESLAVGGIRHDSAVYRFFHKVSRKIYSAADTVLVTSRSFADYFATEFGITDTVYLPQFAESVFNPASCRKEPDGYLDLMFAGNVGTAQSVKTVIEAAKLTADIPALRWHIVGDGSEIEALQQQAKGMPSVIFHGRHALEEMPRYYAMADAMLVTMQKNPILSKTLPGKVQTYMAAGKPIIASADGETSRVVTEAGCGLCSEAENASALAENVRRLVTEPTLMTAFAEKAIDCYRTQFEKNRFMADLVEIMMKTEKKDG